MSRRLRVSLAVVAALAVLGGVFFWVLPEIVRRAAVAQIPQALNRAAGIEDVDLNLFTGQFAIKKLRLAEREGSEAFVEVERVQGRIWLPALLASDVRFTELRIVAPSVRVIRTGPTEFNFSDLLELFTKAEPAKKPSRWTSTQDRISIERGRVVIEDRALSPSVDWSIESLDFEGSGITTRPGREPGRLVIRAKLGGAGLEIIADSLRLAPVGAVWRVMLKDFDLARLRPYMSSRAPAFAERGTVGAALTVMWKREPGRLDTAYATGDVALEELALSQGGRPAPFLTIPRVRVDIKRADLIARDMSLGSVAVEGLDLRVGRDPEGRIDLLTALAAQGTRGDTSQGTPPGRTQSTGQPEAASASPWRIRLERLALKDARIALGDDAVSPRRDWRLDGLTVEAARLSTSPDDAPGTLQAKTEIAVRPGPSGRAVLTLGVDSLRLIPLAASAQLSLNGFDVTSILPYLPAPLPAVPSRGMLGAKLNARLEPGGSGTARATASGSVELTDVAANQPGAPAPFFATARLAVSIRRADFAARDVTLASVEVVGLDTKTVRRRSGEIDVLAAMERASAPGGATESQPVPPDSATSPPPGPWRLRVERVLLRQGRMTLTDEAVAPAREWRLEDLTVEGAGLSTSAQDPPGGLKLKAQLAVSPGGGSPAALLADITSLRFDQPAAVAQLSLSGFDVATIMPYLPATAAAVPTKGRLDLNLNATLEGSGVGLTRALASGNVRLHDAVLVQRGRPAPFFAAPTLGVTIKQADALARTLDLGAVEVDGFEIHAVRDAEGQIDLLTLAQAAPEKAVEALSEAVSTPAPPPSGTAQPVSPPAPAPEWRISVDRFTLANGVLTFEDRDVSPVTTLALTDFALTAERLAWPATREATFTAAFVLPGGGRTEIKGTSILQPLNTQLSISTRDAPIEPYQVYFPFAARLAGFFSGDSLNEIQRGPKGELILASRGAAWARDLEVRAPGAEAPVARLARMEIRGIDFSWPNYALVDRITMTHPRVEIERDPAGAINLRSLFEVRKDEASKEAATEAVSADGNRGKPGGTKAADAGAANSGEGGGLLQNLVLDFKQIVVEDGHGRFIDRTTTPAFSEDISRLALSIRDMSNVLGRQRTTMSAQALVGGDAALDMRGELSGLGETLRADLVGELRDFSLSAANPYAEALTSWLIQRGKLTAHVHYRIEGDQLSAEHDVKFNALKVVRARESDEAKRRIGLPLGLAVALLKDSRGNIDFSVPLHGTLTDRNFDWGEAMWAAVKQVILKVLAAPFNAIGRLFTGGTDTVDRLEVNPVTFAAGSSVIAPATELQLTRIADFLRRTPYVKLALLAVGTAADVENLKSREVTARLQRFQREQGLPDLAAALRVYYQKHEPGLTLPKTADEQLALLIQREPAPAGPLAGLLRRRLEATRDQLVNAEGIPADRLVLSKTPPADLAPAATGDGRVDFSVVADSD